MSPQRTDRVAAGGSSTTARTRTHPTAPPVGRGFNIDPAFARVMESVIDHAAGESAVSSTTLARRVLATFCAEHPDRTYADPGDPLYYRLPAVDTLARRLRPWSHHPGVSPGQRDPLGQRGFLHDSVVIPLRVRDRQGSTHSAVEVQLTVDPKTRQITYCAAHPSTTDPNCGWED